MPLETLLEQAGQNAAMVVLGCRREDGGHLGRLGPVASWIAERVDFPVAVVGRDASAAVPVLIGADPGTVLA
jgi:nucleotide-binding universal stress UspA family protein